MTTNPNHEEDPDTEGRAVPPYDGRRASADVEGSEESTRDGVTVGGATGPVEDGAAKSPEPDDTPGGAAGSPADEQPATPTQQGTSDDGMVGPAHEPGTPRGEDQS